MLFKLKCMSISLILVSNIGCMGLPPAPKIDLGRLYSSKNIKDPYVRFRNPQGTFYNLGIEKSDGYIVFKEDHLIDLVIWMDKFISALKQELVKK